MGQQYNSKVFPVHIPSSQQPSSISGYNPFWGPGLGYIRDSLSTVCTSVVWVSELALNPGSYLGGSFNLIIAFLRKSETQFLIYRLSGFGALIMPCTIEYNRIIMVTIFFLLMESSNSAKFLECCARSYCGQLPKVEKLVRNCATNSAFHSDVHGVYL